jgi:hypothetical protein
MNEQASDRIEITKKRSGPGLHSERIFGKTIHYPNERDLEEFIALIKKARIVEIDDFQDHTPVFDGLGAVVDYAAMGGRTISFLILGDK